MRHRRTLLVAVLAVLIVAVGPGSSTIAAQVASPIPAARSVFLDDAGVIRWRDDRSEVALFGANYVLPSASDYRAAGYVHADRKKMIDDDMAHFARMGWDGLRLTFWGDWESSDRAGNLIANDHLDLFDYLIARARERGIYMLLSPIQTYDANWPDALRDTSPPGFSRVYSRGDLGTKPAAIAAQANYLRQLLSHVNPYTGVAIKDEPAIVFIELVNEPWHHPEDRAGSVHYIDALVNAVRSTGCDKLIFYNVSQDFRIGDAIRASTAQGVTFGWYPSGLNSGHELRGNFLRAVDAYPPMLDAALAALPRIVYEFDTPDLRTGYMYPAMARTFRAVGTQFAAMFAYDMLATASRNLAWQTHYLNLVYTPRKAMSAVIAAEAMRRLPRLRSYGGYPANTRFGDFRVSYEENLGELVADDAFLYTGSTTALPPHPEQLRRVAGVGSSPVVNYLGSGVYFLDKLRGGIWRLEVYPDAVPARDPFEPPSVDKLVTRAIWRDWPMRITLPDLGEAFTIRSLTARSGRPARAANGAVSVAPGVYLLSAKPDVTVESLPRVVGALRIDEFHPPPHDTMAVQIVNETPGTQSTSRPIEITARVVDSAPPRSVTLALRPRGGASFRSYVMKPAIGYDYRATIPDDSLRDGRYEYAVLAEWGDSAATFPGGVHARPWDWNFEARELWQLDVVPPSTALVLFDPGADVEQLAFTRIGDSGRRGLFRLSTSTRSGTPIFHFELPVVDHAGLEDYTASLAVEERIAARRDDIAAARGLRVRLRGLGPWQDLHITLVERDGTSWSAVVSVDSAWAERTILLPDFKLARSVALPQGFPGTWNYWVGPASGRGGPGDRLRLGDVERLQLSLRGRSGVTLEAGRHGVEIESIALVFD